MGIFGHDTTNPEDFFMRQSSNQTRDFEQQATIALRALDGIKPYKAVHLDICLLDVHRSNVWGEPLNSLVENFSPLRCSFWGIPSFRWQWVRWSGTPCSSWDDRFQSGWNQWASGFDLLTLGSTQSRYFKYALVIQHSYGKWPFRVDLPIHTHSKWWFSIVMLAYQRVVGWISRYWVLSGA